MATIHYTPAQNAAIHWKGGNLLLSAAAGSGKTATLTGRILWLLEQENVSIREMCIVTYTRAAAAELRERIAGVLRERVRETGSRHLAAQLAAVSGADIATIHAFLYKSLRPFFSALGLSPDFTIGDEAIMQQLRTEAMAEIVDECFEAGTDEFLSLADTLSITRDTQSLDKTLLEIDRALSAAGKTPSALSAYAKTLLESVDTGADFFSLPQSDGCKVRLAATVAHFQTAISDVRMAFTPVVEEKYGPYADAFLDWLRRISRALEVGSYADVREALSSDGLPPRLATVTAKNATEESLRFKALRDEGKKVLASLRTSLFVFEPAEIPSVLSRTAALLTALKEVLTAYSARYRDKKRARSLLDYGDLESEAVALLIDENGNPTAAAAEIGRQYRYIFIDEYQDTNAVQDAIFRAISQSARRFLVGDIKQSIYRFRGAEPEVFSRYRDRFAPLTPEEANGISVTDADFSPTEGASLFMSENFRCDRAVIELTNLVSALLFPHGAIPYTPDDALVMGKTDGLSEDAEICLIEKPTAPKSDAEDTEEDDDDDTGTDTEDPEAAYVAERIRAYLDHGLSDGTPVSPVEIAILLRSPDSSGDKYRAALAKRHIPVTSPTADPLFVSPAVLLALCMAYTADNPLSDIYLAGALHSPLFGLTTAELTAVHHTVQGGEFPLFIAIERAVFPERYRTEDAADVADMQTLPAETTDKLRYFCDALPELRSWARNLTADRFFEKLFAAYGFYELPQVASDPMEARNLRSLYELARRYGVGGVSAFLQTTETLRASALQENAAAAGVTLTSIHKSKGLEYPIVFVPECAKKRNAMDENGDILFDPALGFGMRLPDPGGFVRCDTILRAAIAEKKRVESVAEEMRVLYVALTRARTKLICTAKVRDPEKFLEKYRAEAAYPTRYRITTADTYIEWLVLSHFSALPSPLRTLRIVTSGTAAETVSEITAETENTAARAEDIAPPAAPYVYPTPEYAAIPAKVSVSALHPGVVDEWLRTGGIATGTDEDTNEAVTDPDDRAAVESGEDGTEQTEAEISPDLPCADCAENSENTAVDVISSAMRSHVPLPRFLTGMDDVRTPADRGTATHMFLQFADFGRLSACADPETAVTTELTRLVDAHFLTPDSARAVYRGQLVRFTESDLFRRMCESGELWREFRFNAALPAARFTNDPALRDKLTADGITLTVQGVVDCVFRDTDGSLTLVDYKTDSAHAQDRRDPAAFAEKLRARHRNQLTYYREICAALFDEPIARTVLYSTALGREIAL